MNSPRHTGMKEDMAISESQDIAGMGNTHIYLNTKLSSATRTFKLPHKPFTFWGIPGPCRKLH